MTAVTTLMIHAGPAPEDAPINRTGGLPLLPDDVEWPRCRDCGGNLQFIARLVQDQRVVQVFMCDNDPGSCESWEPNGANAVLVAPAGPAPVRRPPAEGVTTLGSVSAFELVHSDAVPAKPYSEPYDAAREEWLAGSGRKGRQILGQLGGTPSWIQGDQVPDCPECGVPQRFVAQLEEGADHRTSANYGGGCAYVFACAEHDLGTFLWQQ